MVAGIGNFTRPKKAVLVAVALIGSTVAVGLTPALPVSAAANVSASVDQNGFPLWYEDAGGTRLDACLSVNDPHCVLIPTPGVFDSQQPIAFPTNFPDEFFYSVTDSDKLTTPGCAGAADPLAAQPGKAFVRMALEGAFVNGLPAIGEQMVFGRVRIVVRGGLCPDTAYTFTHPYGTTTLTTDASGSIPPSKGTVDIGCVPVAPQTCNFSQATASPLFSGFLRWDPAVAPAADPGYLGGDPAVLHPITGGVNNVFSVADASNNVVVSTNLFTVAGRLAGPVVASPESVDFGGQVVGSGNGQQTVTLTNVGANPLLVNPGGITTDNPEFVVGSSSCPTSAPGLARDATCTVQVTFTPTTTGVRTGNLSIVHNGLHSPFSVALQGTGTNPGQEAGIAFAPTTLAFGSVRIGTISTSQTVAVSNPGTAPLQVTGLEFVNVNESFDSLDKNAFRIMHNGCAGIFVPATATAHCDVAVAFQPTNTHAYAAALKVSANTANGPTQVTLNATGIGGVAAVSKDANGNVILDPSNGFPIWYQDEAGARVGQCLQFDNPMCIVLPDDFYTGGPVGGIDANGNMVNFPEEFFYFVADSDIISTPGCGSSPPGKAFVRMADEAAFVNSPPANGEQMVFGRLRIVVTSGLCPNTTYTFTHPYGQVDITTDAAGGVRRNAATQDIGCFPVAPETCDFTQALASPVLGGFLSQVNAPGGYLGDPNVLDAVTGSPYIAQREIDAAGPGGTPASANYFRIVNKADPAQFDAETDQFTVMGKLAGPLVANPTSVDYGTVEVATTSADKTVTFTNEGIAGLTVNGVTKTGTNAADFVITNNGCDGQVLQPKSVNSSNSSCQVKVQFAPTANGARSAELSVDHTGRNNPLTVALSGIGGAQAGQPAISVNPVSVTFPDLHTGQTSASATIHVSNLGGTANLSVGAVAITGAGAANFQFTNGCAAAGVAPNAECTIDVRFAPTAAGDQSATLQISHNVGIATNPLSIPLSGRGFAGAPAQSVATTAGFPSWYQDNNGVRVEPCLTIGDPNCVLLPDAGFNPSLPLSFPTNFPTEFFYSLVDSDPTFTVTDPNCGRTGDVFMRIALEGTFANGAPVDGDQTVFGRVRFVAHNLCPNSTYEFTHPYGTTRITTNGVGAIPANTGTTDLTGVLTARPLAGGPQQVSGGGQLRWDPNQGPAAPAGYLGDARTFHPIVGSTFRPGGPNSEPANYMEVHPVAAGGIVGASLGRTSSFIVSGKLAGPVVSNTASLSFGSTAIGLTSAAQTVTITNLFPTPISGITPTLTGADAASFTITGGGTCTAATSLGRDQSCTVTVAFKPLSPVGAKAASLSIGHNGLRSPVTVSLAGTAVDPGRPAVQVSPTSLAFGNQNINTSSAARTITVSNTGNASLDNIVVSKTGTNASEFNVTTNCPASLGFGSPTPSCTVTVVFAPVSNGNKTAQVRIASNDPVRPTVTVNLTGTGTAPVMSVSPTSLSFSTKGTSTTSINVSNTGTAPLSLVGNPALLMVSSGLATSDPTKFSAANNGCNNVAPGGKCTIQVTFTPGAGTNNQTYTAKLQINSNAVNSPLFVSLTGVRK